MVTRTSFATVAGALLGASVCTVQAWTGQALAADMGYAPPPEYSLAAEQQATIGNGWYLRGDAGWSRENSTAITVDPALASALGTRNGWVASVGAGYQFNDYFRTDLTLDYRNVMRANARSEAFACITDVMGVENGAGSPIGITALDGNCYSRQSANFKRTSLLANAYLDLGTWAGVTPYIGAGAGLTYGRASGTYNWHTTNNDDAYAPDIPYPTGYPPIWLTATGAPTTGPAGFTFGQQNRRVDVSKSQTNFTWALMAGLAYAISPNAKIDFGYRFVNMGSFTPNAPKKEGQIQEFRVGLRYSPD